MEFNEHSSLNVRSTLIEELSFLQLATASFVRHQMVIIDQKPKVMFTISITLKQNEWEHAYTLHKLYKDFRTLHQFLLDTAKKQPSVAPCIPRLPQKL